jgi:transposase
VKFKLTRNEKRNLSKFVKRTKDKMEYARTSAILMRSKGMKVKQVANSLHVCVGAVFKWERLYRRNGLDGLRSRKPPGRPARKRPAARRLIPMLLKKDP